MRKCIDLTGKRFERLLVIDRCKEIKGKNAYWNCICDCGKKAKVSSSNLRRGLTKSCGCLSREVHKETIKKMHKVRNEKYWIENTSLPLIATKKVRINSTTGITGVSRRGNRYRAYIKLQGKDIHLGYFDHIKDAAKARKEAEIKYFKPLIDKYKKNIENMV